MMHDVRFKMMVIKLCVAYTDVAYTRRYESLNLSFRKLPTD